MINTKIISILNIFFVVAVLSAPWIIYAQGANSSIDSTSVANGSGNSLVKCTDADSCNWDEFINTLNRVKDYGFQLVVVLSVIFIVYAGGIYLTSAGNSGKIQQAHNILSNVVIGFFLAAAGWLIVHTILKTLDVKSEFTPGDIGK
jgi:hypothetical protein